MRICVNDTRDTTGWNCRASSLHIPQEGACNPRRVSCICKGISPLAGRGSHRALQTGDKLQRRAPMQPPFRPYTLRCAIPCRCVGGSPRSSLQDTPDTCAALPLFPLPSVRSGLCLGLERAGGLQDVHRDLSPASLRPRGLNAAVADFLDKHV